MNCYSLLTDCFHSILHSFSYFISIYAMFISKNYYLIKGNSIKTQDRNLTYGKRRAEVLAAYTNLLFLIFICFYMLLHSLHGLVEHTNHEGHTITQTYRFHIVRVRVLLETALVLYMFRYYNSKVQNSSHVLNMKVLLMHAFSDVLFDLGYIVSLYLFLIQPWTYILMSTLVLFMLTPLFKSSCAILLQKSPFPLKLMSSGVNIT